MPWQLAITISILSITVTSLVKRHHSQKSLAPPTFPPAISYLLGVAPLGIIAGLLLGHHARWGWWVVWLFVLEAVAMAFANWLGFKAIKRMQVSQNVLISESKSILVVMLGWILLGEGLAKFQLIGAIMLFMAALLAVMAPKNLDAVHKKLHTDAVLLTLLSAITGAIGLVTEKAILGHMDIGIYLMIGYPAQTLGMLVLATKDLNKQTIKTLTKHEISWSGLMGLANGVAGVFYVAAIVNSNNISLVTAIGSITLPLVAFGAYAFLKEKEDHRLVWAGLALGFVGLLVSALR